MKERNVWNLKKVKIIIHGKGMTIIFINQINLSKN